MKKLLLFILAIPLLSLSCNKKNQTPEEYFSFYADGKEYKYLQEKGYSYAVGEWQTLVAGQTSSFGYIIRAHSLKSPVAQGEFTFLLSENKLPSEDTIILGINRNSVSIENFLNFNDNYKMRPPLSGRIIFTERNNNRLTGTFEFDVELYRTPSFANTVWTDTILHITKGKFSIIPSL